MMGLYFKYLLHWRDVCRNFSSYYQTNFAFPLYLLSYTVYNDMVSVDPV